MILCRGCFLLTMLGAMSIDGMLAAMIKAPLAAARRTFLGF